MDTTQLATVFQAGEHNPLVGLEGRVTLLHRLGHALAGAKEIFGRTAAPVDSSTFDSKGPDSTTGGT